MTIQKANTLALMLASIGATPEDVAKASNILGDSEAMKAVAMGTEGAREVESLWDRGNFHRVPTSEEIKTGPWQAASGGGAERMISEYSRPAPQRGTTLEAEGLERELGTMRGYMKAQGERMDAFAKVVEGLTTVSQAILAKAAADPEAAVDVAGAADFSKRAVAKAEFAFSGARRLLAKAAKLADDLDEMEGDARKVAKAQIKTLRGDAARMLVKARDASFAAMIGEQDPAAAVRKSINDLLEDNITLKADVSAFHEKEDDEKKAEKKMKKIAKKAMKAAAEKASRKAAKAEAGKSTQLDANEAATKANVETGNQADKQEAENGNQAAAAKAIEVDNIKKAVDGLSMQIMSVQGMLETVTGRAITNNVGNSTVELLKSKDPGQLYLAVSRRIDDAEDTGSLQPPQVIKAQDLLSKLSAVGAGTLSRDTWDSYLNQSPIAIQQLFREAA